jgi:hypothetical protein
MWQRLVNLWRAKPYACPDCAWQGMMLPVPPFGDAQCPECGAWMAPRTWAETWGLTLIILGSVVVAVLFVAFAGR